MEDATPDKLVRKVYVLLLFNGLIAVLVITSLLFSLTKRIDEAALTEAHAKLALLLEERQTSLRLAVEDYSYWTVAYETIMANDEGRIYDYLGSGASESELFDWLVILSSEGAVLHAFEASQFVENRAFLAGEASKEILDALRRQAPQDYVSVNGFFRASEQVVLASAAWVTPDNMNGVDAARLPVLVAGKNIDAEAIARMELLSGAQRIELGAQNSGSADASFFLSGPKGLANQMQVTPRLTGTTVRNEFMPWLLLACAVVALISYAVARSFGSLAMELQQAISVAFTDQLTGISNRAALETFLASPRLAAALANGDMAVLSIDLDRFKELNDTRGHGAGDQALKITAKRLKNAMRSSDHVVRTGGDEFLCLIIDTDPETASRKVVDRISKQFSFPIEMGGEATIVELSIGVAIGRKGDTWEAIVARSDSAMYAAKVNRTFQHVLF
jgi:diguanylate cyclase (GGDEF)-like protein